MSYIRQAMPADEIPRALTGFVAILGALVALSPFFLSFSGNVAATANALVCGMALVVLAAMNKDGLHPWAERSTLGLGAWIAVSPWLFQPDDAPWVPGDATAGFAPKVSVHIALGIAVFVVGAFVIARSSPWRLRGNA